MVPTAATTAKTAEKLLAAVVAPISEVVPAVAGAPVLFLIVNEQVFPRLERLVAPFIFKCAPASLALVDMANCRMESFRQMCCSLRYCCCCARAGRRPRSRPSDREGLSCSEHQAMYPGSSSNTCWNLFPACFPKVSFVNPRSGFLARFTVPIPSTLHGVRTIRGGVRTILSDPGGTLGLASPKGLLLPPF